MERDVLKQKYSGDGATCGLANYFFRGEEKRLMIVKHLMGKNKIEGIIPIEHAIDQFHACDYTTRESKSPERDVIRNSGAGYFFIDKDGYFRNVNQAWLHMHGFTSEEEILGKHFSVTQVTSDLDQAQQNVSSLMQGKVIPSGEFSRLCKDGSIKYHVFSASPVYKNEMIIGVEGFIIDTTEQKQILEKLQFERNKLQAIMEAANQDIYVVNRQHEIEYANEILEKDFGALKGARCFECMHDFTEPCPWCKNEVFEGKVVQWEWHSEKKGKDFECIDAPPGNTNGTISKLGILKDVTDHKKC